MVKQSSNLKSEYDPSSIEKKWQAVWEKNRTFSPDLANAKNPYYALMMFPYPSAEGLHVGNMYAFTGADVHGRFKRMQGKDVFEPIGLDGFGIHSENYAIKVGKHPKEQAEISQKNFYRQLRATGNAYDWTRTLETYTPAYYRWTQWIFVQMFKKGLAYRKKAQVNWCPSCKTVLADEQVLKKIKNQKSKIKNTSEKSKVNEISIGVCERCETEVEKRNLEQWFFKITEYADRLLYGLTQIDWPEKIKIAQRQWIGRSEGARIEFKVQSSKLKIDVFTTRQDTLYGATFLVLAPEHPVSSSIKERNVQDYIKKAKAKTDQERITEGKEKTGVFSDFYAVNPLNNEKIPIWIADYAVMGYGTGALFGDAHDERDVEFAKKYNIPLKPTIITGDKKRDERIMSLDECYIGYGKLVDSGEFTGLTSEEAKKRITAWLKKHNAGGPQITYHLRDWLISRQRYWGPPIPMIYCSTCEKNSQGERKDMPGWWTVPEGELPVELPDVEDWRPEGTGTSPLANHPEFYETKCPSCSSPAKRETDVSDTFLDSSWYYLRYLSIGNGKKQTNSSKSIKKDHSLEIGSIGNLKFDIPYDPEIVRRWCPIAIYIGGAEHSVLHLLYVRFVWMFLADYGFLPFSARGGPASGWNEPFPRFYAHGLLISEGAKMSKSRGNVIVPDEYIKKFGADTLRMYLMFLGPFEDGGDFRDTGVEGMNRFVRRVWKLFNSKEFGKDDPETLRTINKTIKEVTRDIKDFSYNTAIAKLMKFYNFISEDSNSWSRETAEAYLKLFAPFAPHATEELWQRMNQEVRIKKQGEIDHDSIHFQAWPTFDEKYLVQDQATIPIQINGKRRGEIQIESSKLKIQSEIEEKAKEAVRTHLEGKEIKKVIYVPGRIINFVI